MKFKIITGKTRIQFLTRHFGDIHLNNRSNTYPSYIIFQLNEIIDIPSGILIDATYLFILTFAGYLISLVSGILNTSMFMNNRLDLSRKVDIIRVITRLVIIVALFNLRTPSLLSVE